MELLDFIFNGRLLFAILGFGVLAAAEPFIDAWIGQAAAQNAAAAWSWQYIGMPLLRACLVVGFVYAAYPALFGLREAPALSTLLTAGEARPSTVIGLLFIVALFAPVLPFIAAWPALLLPLQGILATAFLFKWMTSYLAITTSSVWPGDDLMLAIVLMSLLTHRIAQHMGFRLGQVADTASGRDGYDTLLAHVISRQIQLPVIVIYAVGLARQIAI